MWLKRSILTALIGMSLGSAHAEPAAPEDFRVKGFHIDLKVQTMTMDALKRQAEELAGMGINALLMEWEATFPFERNAVICNKYAYKPEEIKDFIKYCSGIGVDVIPLQQCFGHVEYILQHGRYAPLRENFRSEFSQVCPLNPASEKAFRSILEEVGAMHPSEYFHIGCDETFLLGLCPKCSEYAREHGRSKLFVDYVARMCGIVTEMGKRPILWADIITKYPEAVGQLPKDAILMDWNYGWDIKLFGDIDKIYASGLEIWGAPAIRSDPDTQYLITWKTHFDNQRDFIPYCREAGYKGIVMTSWSASGLYGLFYEVKNEVVQIDAVRNVYPASGFGLLTAMYGQALKQRAPIDPEKFTTGYARERFGLSESEGRRLWEILSKPQLRLKFGQPTGKGKTIERERDETAKAREALSAMKPSRNEKEFGHFLLQTDIRLQYLEFKIIDGEFNSPEFNRSKAAGLLRRLEDNVMSRTADLDRRFTELNGEYLKREELLFQNSLRVRRINYTYDALKAML